MLGVGQTLQGRYLLERPLGRGGMATAYLVRDLVSEQSLALKLLRAPTTDLLDAFRREFFILARARHPQLLGVYDFGTTRIDDERVVFYTADFVDGVSLATYADGRDWETLSRPYGDALTALAFLHGVGIRHGDIKPDNILVTAEGRGVLIDLGCAHETGAGHRGLSGSPGFLAPELLSDGTEPSERSDLYSSGSTLSALLPHLSSPPPADVTRLVERLTDPEPRGRPSDVAEVLEILGFEKVSSVLSSLPELLGREQEIVSLEERLDALWLDRVEGGGVLWITGPSGVGRSRLLQEMAWRAQLRGVVVECVHSEPLPILSMIRRATPVQPMGVSGLVACLDGLDALRAHGEPTVFVIDDVHRLSGEERTLFEGLLRSLDPADPVLILCSSLDVPSDERLAPSVLELGPLEEAEVLRWAEPYVSTRNLPTLMCLSGGYPSVVEALLAEVVSGAIREDRLGERHGSLGMAGRLDRLEDLNLEEREGLVLVALHDGFVDGLTLRGCDVPDSALETLHGEGWIVPDGSGWKLRRAADSHALLDRIAEVEVELLGLVRLKVIQTIRDRIERADPQDRSRRSELTAQLVRALSDVNEKGEIAEARELLETFDRRGLGLRQWCRAVDALAVRLGGPTIQLIQAAIHCEAGNPDEGLRVLERFLFDQPEMRWMNGFRLQAARCYLRLGDGRRCLRQARRALQLEREGDVDRLALVDVLARALIQVGEYREALDRSREALTQAVRTDSQAALNEDVGVAASYLGDADLARTHLSAAESLLRSGGSPRDRVRLSSYQGINEYREGKTSAAVRAYEQALAMAEDQGLSDQIAAAALNLGTACHQQGDWGRALQCYELGLRTALALGTESTTVIVRCNLAQLYGDIGALDRARSVLDEVESMIVSLGVSPLAGLAASLRASLELLAGRRERARDQLDRAKSIYAGLEARREVAEVDLQRAELELGDGNLELAQAALEGASNLAVDLDAVDLRARARLVAGKLAAARGDADGAVRDLRRARDLSREVEQLALEAESEGVLADAYQIRAADYLARRHSERARELWERVVVTLPTQMLDAFWSHPRRQLAIKTERSKGDETTIELPQRVSRLLEIYRQLGSSLRIPDVLRCTLDAAIELTGAERGFLILRRDEDPEALEVPFARNLDREKIGRSHLKFSKSIAEEVIATGEPMLTVDALADQRFRGNESVHAMRLRSVISVPIRSREGVLGALYLDNRFERGRFKQEDRSLLMAFADQAAIALNNARLVAALERRTEELEKERRRVEAHVQSQAEQIDRLSEDLRSRQRTLEHRYDYGHIVGRGPAMARVLSVFDKVIETNLPVLFQGESGTGKELCARAVHFNGPRRAGPFVTVNCAALTETLLESELFGHVKGSFTGALRDRTGLFVEARGGTLFLDEIGEMPLGMQAKLLRVLQEQEVRPVGSEAVIDIDVRILAATNRRLREEVTAGRFREDLFYRVVVVEVELPALRERVEDIPALVRHILDELAVELERESPKVSSDAHRKLARYSWPGNVRQLKNILSKAIVLAEGDLHAADIELPHEQPKRQRPRSRSEYETKEANLILAALESHGWNVSSVARTLGMPRSSLYRKLEKYEINKG